MRICGKVLLLVTWVWLPSTASSGGMLPLELWCQASPLGAPQKITSCQNHALFRMVWQDRFISARALTVQVRNLYGKRAGRKTISNRLLSCGYHDYRPTNKPPMTTIHRRLCLEWAQRWQNLTMAHWQHVIFGDESRFHLYLVDVRLRIRPLPGPVSYLLSWVK